VALHEALESGVEVPEQALHALKEAALVNDEGAVGQVPAQGVLQVGAEVVELTAEPAEDLAEQLRQEYVLNSGRVVVGDLLWHWRCDDGAWRVKLS
jgi:hypothetical protein